jgi:hypothetical protein
MKEQPLCKPPFKLLKPVLGTQTTLKSNSWAFVTSRLIAKRLDAGLLRSWKMANFHVSMASDAEWQFVHIAQMWEVKFTWWW